MRHKIALALFVASSPLLAQQSGVSRPPAAVVEEAPAAAIPAAVAVPMPESAAVNAASEATKTAPTLTVRARASNPDEGIVTEVVTNANELPAGTLMRVRLRNEIGTDTTQVNAPFVAEVAESLESNGRVIVPAGATVEGRITQIRGGRRLHGAAIIHMLADAVVMPDGSRIALHADVIDTDQYAHTSVDGEGNIVRKDHVGATLAAMSLTTGSAAAAGAVFGGGFGALVGAGVGAGVSTAWWLKQDRQAHLPEGTLLVLGLTEPLVVAPEAKQPNFAVMPAATTTRIASTDAIPAQPALN